MATTVQGLPGVEQLTATREGAWLFGIRHLSPAGAWHLTRFLEEKNPDCVLIEGPQDATALIPELANPAIKPPVAILSYTADVPVHSILYPFAAYSPEFRAVLWAVQNKKQCRFIDLPSDSKVPLYRLQNLENLEYQKYNRELYEEIARLGGEETYDIYWERLFEHDLRPDSYRQSVALHSAQIRALTRQKEWEADPVATSINTLREAFMKRCIHQTIESGVQPDKIVIITGAYHTGGLVDNQPMTDEEVARLPKSETRLTLMPYSYYKLSTYAGYGAGNHAPYYYEMLWQAMQAEKNLAAVPALYLSGLSGLLRKKHGYSSTATVMEAVRLANALQDLHGGLHPTLQDLHDAALCTMAGGQGEEILESFARLDVGTKIGYLPQGVSQTPIQDDMNRHLKKLKLESFQSVVAQDLALDLRENRRAKSREAAFLDLERSKFLHQLKLLDTGFAQPLESRQDAATWAENWVLCWTPEVEIHLVESVLYGDTIQAAASYILRENLKKSEDVGEVAKLVHTTCVCGLSHSIFDALKKLQTLTSESDSFPATAQAASEMAHLLQYGSIRRFETEPLLPVLQQLFLKAALLLAPAASCDEKTAQSLAEAITHMHYITQEVGELIEDETWLRQLSALAKSDEKNPLLCGFAFSILLERGQISEEELHTEISRRLSPGNTPEAGAGWFEGLSRRNRYLLLSRLSLWKQLDFYLSALGDTEFKRALVCLRRTFSTFTPAEKTGICEVLAELWQLEPADAAGLLQTALNEQEQAAIDALNDFDFGDLL